MPSKTADSKNAGPARILIVDDHWVVVEGLKNALDTEPDFVVAGTASDGREAVEKARALRPDIVVMDISMPRLNGVEAVSEIRKFNQGIKFIIFTMYSDREYVIPLFRLGISAYVLKEGALSDLILALKSVSNEGTYFSPPVQRIVRDHMEELEVAEHVKTAREVGDGLVKLSVREKEVFPLLADGMSTKQIGKRLYISPKTVESHKYNIMDKLGVSSLAALTKLAIKKKLIEL